MKLMHSPQAMAALRQQGDATVEAIGRDTLWSQRAPCHKIGDVKSSEHMISQDIGEGYSEKVDGHDTRIGHIDNACDDQTDVAILRVDARAGTYSLKLPSFSIPTDVPGQANRGNMRLDLGAPEITIKGQRYVEGKPLRGSKTFARLITVEDTPVWNRTGNIPMKAVVTWEFMPD